MSIPNFSLLLECNAIFYGCLACSARDDTIASVQCDKCDFNKFLLSVNSNSGVDTSSLAIVPTQ